MERLVDPLTTIDAKLWADEFMKVKARLGEQKFDHAMMLGWFANAIMQGYDEGQRRAKADAQATVEALRRERDEEQQRLRVVCQQRNDAMTALDAEREKVTNLDAMYRQQLGDRDKRIEALAGSAKIWMERYTQLQALVRKFVDSIQPVDCVEVDELLREARAALDSTTPAGQRLTPNEATE